MHLECTARNKQLTLIFGYLFQVVNQLLEVNKFTKNVHFELIFSFKKLSENVKLFWAAFWCASTQKLVEIHKSCQLLNFLNRIYLETEIVEVRALQKRKHFEMCNFFFFLYCFMFLPATVVLFICIRLPNVIFILIVVYVIIICNHSLYSVFLNSVIWIRCLVAV